MTGEILELNKKTSIKEVDYRLLSSWFPLWLAVAPCPFGPVAGRSQGQIPHVLGMIGVFVGLYYQIIWGCVKWGAGFGIA